MAYEIFQVLAPYILLKPYLHKNFKIAKFYFYFKNKHFLREMLVLQKEWKASHFLYG